jgi:hypothetical protein
MSYCENNFRHISVVLQCRSLLFYQLDGYDRALVQICTHKQVLKSKIPSVKIISSSEKTIPVILLVRG